MIHLKEYIFTKWFSLMEVIVSVSIFVIFSTGYIFFLMQENMKNEQDEYVSSSNGLIQEVKEFVKNSGIDSFSWGIYSLSYSGGTNTYTMSPSDDLYIDGNGIKVSASASGSFKRDFVITWWSLSFSGSIAIPNISLVVNIWYPGCSRDKTPCISKDSILY